MGLSGLLGRDIKIMRISVALGISCDIIFITNPVPTTMITSIAPIAGLDLAALTALAFAKRDAVLAREAAEGKTQVKGEPRITRLLRFRAENPALFESRRIEGMKKSSLVRENLLRLHREKKEQWRASAMKNPKLRATDQHIAAKEWVLRAPDGQTHTFRNLKKWVRENEELFETDDVIWKEMNGKANQAWCRAFQALGRLRPSSSKHLEEWKGWTWAGSREVEILAKQRAFIMAAGASAVA